MNHNCSVHVSKFFNMTFSTCVLWVIDKMSSHIGLKRKDLILLWMIPTGYQAACIVNLCHLGATERAYIAFLNVSVASEDSDNPSMSHRGFLCQLALCSTLSLSQHIFSPWGCIHSPFAFYTSLPVSPRLALPLCQALCSSQVPHRPRQRAGMPIASSQPPLRGADATALLPGDSLTHINTSTHTHIIHHARPVK